MVIYDLVCKKNHRFEGWFPSFESYQEQAGKGLVCCPECGTKRVEKLPHACAVHVKREAKEVKKEKPRAEAEAVSPPPPAEAEIKEALIRLHHYVRENFEDVGPRFAEEAREIFHGKAKSRSIHGTSTRKEAEALDEEGVPYAILPKPELDG